MDKLFKNLGTGIDTVFGYILGIVAIVAALAILVNAIRAFRSDEKGRKEYMMNCVWILIFVAVAAAAKGLASWAFGL